MLLSRNVCFCFILNALVLNLRSIELAPIARLLVATTSDVDGPSVYQDIPELSNLTSQRGLKFLHQDVCSFLPKVDEIRLLLLRYKDIDFFSTTETHLSSHISDDEIGIQGYTIYRLDCQAQSKGGGVGV